MLYSLETQGVDQAASKFKQVDLAAKYSETSLRGFDASLKAITSSGTSVTQAINDIAKSQRTLGAEAQNIARDIIANDRAMRASKEENARAAAAEAAAEQRAANQIYQARQRLWQQTEQANRQSRNRSDMEGRERQQANLHLLSAGAGELGLGRAGTTMARGIAGGMGGFGAYGLISPQLMALGAASAGIEGIKKALDFTKEAAASAQQLTNLSNEFGLSTAKVFQFQAAARMTGEDLGTMSQAARKLATAIEEPGGAGKKTVEQLSKMGISIREGMGTALEEVIKQLGGIEDPAQRAAAAIAIFGRDGAKMGEIARAMKDVSSSMDEGVTRSLTQANKVLEDMDIKWTVLKANFAAGIIIPIVTKLSGALGDNSSFMSATRGIGDTLAAALPGSAYATAHGTIGPPPKPGAPGVPSNLAGLESPWVSADSLRKALAGEPTDKLSKQEQLADLKQQYSTLREQARNDAAFIAKNPRGSANVTQSSVDEEAKRLPDLRKQIEKLEARTSTRLPKIDPYSNALQSYQESAETSDLGPIGSAQRERDAFARRFAGTTHGIDAQRQSQLGYDQRLGFDLNTGSLASGRGILGKIAQENAKSAMEEARRNEETMDTSGYQSMLGLKPIMGANGQPITPKNWNNDTKAFTNMLADQRKDLEDARPDQQLKEFVREDNKRNLGSVQRQAGLVQSLRNANGTNTPGSEYSASIDLAQKEYQIRLDGINRLASEEDKITQKYQAQGDLLAQIDEARIKRAEQLAEKAQAQQKETGQFFSGWVSAAISGEPNATGNFLRSFGQQQFSKIVSNFAENSIGSLNKWTGLNKTGAMGTADNPNFLGKILKGTPLDFDASSKDNIKDATVDNTTATNKNTDALNNLMKGGSGSGGGGGDTSGLSSEGSTVSVRPSGGGGAASAVTGAVGSASSIAHAIQSGNPSQIISSIAGLGKVFSGGGGGSDYRNMSESMSATPMAFGGGSNAYSDMSLPGAYSGFHLPNLGALASGSGGSRAASDANAPLGSDGLPLDSQLSLPTDTYGMNLSNAGIQASINSIKPDAVSAQGTLGAAQGFSAALGKAFGNFGSGAQQGLSGYGLQNLFNGSTSDQFGAAGVAGSIASMGGAVAGGTLQAISGFGQGGARGDIGGLAGIATAIAPFTGPAAPFIEAGAMGLNLIKSLFPDPRQERIKQEARTLVNQQYIQPAAHDYSFSATGDGGNTWSEGGGLSSGGNTSTTNNHFLIQASDAQSFYEAMKRDPNQLSQVILSGLGAASAGQLGALINYTAQYGGT